MLEAGATLALQAGTVVIEMLLGFFGFWLSWQVLLPLLPGPRGSEERIAPFAHHFTGPLIRPLVRYGHVRPWFASTVLLFGVGFLVAGLELLSPL